MQTESPEIVEDVPAGIRKAAVFLLAVGDDLAREVFTRLTEEEIRELGSVAVGLEDVTRREVETVLREFRQRFDGKFIPSRGAGGMFHLMVEKALGEDRASALFHQDEGGETDPFATIDSVDPSTLAKLLTDEHPQTIAIVLSSIDSKTASGTLDEFDADVASDVVYRMAHLDAVSEDVRRDIGMTLAAEIESMDVDPAADAERTEQVTVDVMKSLPREKSDDVFRLLEERDEVFARDMRGKIFTFEDLSAVDARSMQRLLREVDSSTLGTALKGASEELSELVFESMSSRAAEMLRDDIDAMGPTRLSDVESAQKAVLEIAMQLEEQGVLTIPRGGDSELV